MKNNIVGRRFFATFKLFEVSPHHPNKAHEWVRSAPKRASDCGIIVARGSVIFVHVLYTKCQGERDSRVQRPFRNRYLRILQTWSKKGGTEIYTHIPVEERDWLVLLGEAAAWQLAWHFLRNLNFDTVSVFRHYGKRFSFFGAAERNIRKGKSLTIDVFVRDRRQQFYDENKVKKMKSKYELETDAKRTHKNTQTYTFVSQ